MWIGEYKIKGVFDAKDKKFKTVSFKNEHPDVTLQKDLYDMVVREEKGRGNVTDAVNHVLATKFLAEMAEYGLEHYMAANIGTAMQTLAHNMREELIKKTFNCTGGDSIPLSKLMQDYV